MNGNHENNHRLPIPFALLACLAAAASAATPQYHLPLDGDTKWSGRDADAAKPAIIHGASKWADGISGKALLVTRHAYDQVTALVADALPNVSTRHGTLAFWFRPDWDQLDGEKHVLLNVRDTKWRPFRIYMVKGTNGQLDVSLVESKQVQHLRRDVFQKGVWTHIALTWDSIDGKVCLYQDGKLLAQKAAPAAFDIKEETVDLVLQLGEGTDRFKANVGNGSYDDLRLYDIALSADEVFILASNDEAVSMRPVAPPAGNAILLSHAESSLPSAAPILRFATSGGAQFTLTAMGASRMLSLVGKTDAASAVVTGADTLDLRTGYALAFIPRGKRLTFAIDGAVQGDLELDRNIGSIASIKRRSLSPVPVGSIGALCPVSRPIVAERGNENVACQATFSGQRWGTDSHISRKRRCVPSAIMPEWAHEFSMVSSFPAHGLRLFSRGFGGHIGGA